MKKILAILASITIIGSATTTVIACGTNEDKPKNDHLFDSVKLKEEIRKKMIFQLKNNNQLGFDLGDLWNNISEKIDKFINNWIDDNVTKLYTNQEVEDKYSSALSMAFKNKSNEVQYGIEAVNDSKKNYNTVFDEVDKLNEQSSVMTFFTQYASSISKTNFNALELKDPRKYGKLNNVQQYNQKELTNPAIYFKTGDSSWKRWTALSDLGADKNSQAKINEVILGKYIPDQAMLSAKQTEERFVMVNNGTQLDLTALPAESVTLSGLDALAFRFHDYLLKQQQDNYEDMLATQFMRYEMYRFTNAPDEKINPDNKPSLAEQEADSAVYYNASSHFMHDVQGWEEVQGQENFSTDLKMVWTISLTDPALQKAADDLLIANQDASSKTNSDFATYSDQINLVNKDNQGNSILQILNLLAQIDGSGVKTEEKGDQGAQNAINRVNAINESQSGIDPIFGIKGFQGFTKDTDNSVEAVLGGNLSVAEAAKAKINETTGPSALKSFVDAGNGDTHFIFDNGDSDKQTTKDIILVLPVYLVDILRSVTDPNSTTPKPEVSKPKPNELFNYVTGQWVRLLPQVNADWKGLKPVANSNWVEVKENSETLPTTNAFKFVEGDGYYVYITNKENNKLTIGSTEVTFSWTNNEQDSWEWNHNYGLVGVGQNNLNDKLTNGQLVKFNVHLGDDVNLPDKKQKLWEANDSKTLKKHSDDIAYFLKSEQKEFLLNILMQIVQKDNNDLHEQAKNQVYRLFISENDIYYKTLYNRLINYIKNEDSEEESD